MRSLILFVSIFFFNDVVKGECEIHLFFINSILQTEKIRAIIAMTNKQGSLCDRLRGR